MQVEMCDGCEKLNTTEPLLPMIVVSQVDTRWDNRTQAAVPGETKILGVIIGEIGGPFTDAYKGGGTYSGKFCAACAKERLDEVSAGLLKRMDERKKLPGIKRVACIKEG